jgi:hypothetical protein
MHSSTEQLAKVHQWKGEHQTQRAVQGAFQTVIKEKEEQEQELREPGPPGFYIMAKKLSQTTHRRLSGFAETETKKNLTVTRS